MTYFINQDVTWWELFDKKGNCLKILLRSEFELGEAISAFTEYLNSISEEPVYPVFRDIAEIYTQGH